MKKFILLWLGAWAGICWAAPPDCTLVATLTAAGTTQSLNNIQGGCVAWNLTYSSQGFSAVSIQLESAPKTSFASVPGSFVLFGGTTIAGSNPLTSTASGYFTGTGYFPWIRVNLGTATGTGTVDITLYGWKSPTFVSSLTPVITGGSANTFNAVSHNYLNSFNSTTGNFTAAQPVSTDISDFTSAASAAAPIQTINFNGSPVTPVSGIDTLVSPVTSVFGRTTAVVAVSGDYTAAQVTNAAATNSTNTFTGTQKLAATGNCWQVYSATGVNGICDDGSGGLYLEINGVSKFQITSGGNTTISGTTTSFHYSTNSNCSSTASPAVCGSSPSGSFVLAASATSVTVNTSATFANSQILITQDSGLGTRLGVTCNTTNANAMVTGRVTSTSFTITGTAPTTNPACFSYTIIN